MLKKFLTYLPYLIITFAVSPIIALAAITVPWNRTAVGTESPLYPIDGILVTASSTLTNNLTLSSLSQGLVYTGTNSLLQSISTSTLTASSPLTGSFTQVGTGGALGCQTASGSQAGCLSSADWTTFNNKGSGTLTAVTGTYPVQSTGGNTPVISLAFGTTTANTWSQLQTFTNGVLSNASSTIGGGTQITGLTIFGGATTTLNALFSSQVGIGTMPGAAATVLEVSTSNSSAVPTNISAFNGQVEFANVSDSGIFAGIKWRSRTTNSAQAMMDLQYNSTLSNGQIFLAIRDSSTTNKRVMDWLANGNVGIGTTTPYAQLSVATPPGATGSLDTLFAVASSTPTATTTLFAVMSSGWVVTSGQKPTAGTCGSTQVIDGNQTTGSITFTGTLVTSCAINFVTPVPAGTTLQCTVSGNSLVGFADVAATTTSSLTVGLSSGLAAGTIWWNCSATRNANN